MTDALAELRRAIMAGEEVDIDKAAVIIASSSRLDRSLLTNFHSMRGRGDPYRLEAVFFQYRCRDMPYNDYIQACRQEGVARVTPLDKKNLIAFLKGDIDTCANIVSKPSDPSVVRSNPATDFSGSPRPSTSDSAKHNPDQGVKRTASEAGHEKASFSAQRKRNRDQRALDSVLMVAEWDFSNLREKLSQHITSAKVGKSNPSGNGSKQNQPAYDPRGDRYTNNEGRFWRENLGSEFQELGIDMGGSFKAKPTSSAANGSADKHRDKRDSRPRPSNESAPKRKVRQPQELVPIIIVPSGSTLIFSGNAVEFFQNGRFLSVEELKKQESASDLLGSSRATAVRKPGGNCSQAKYLIVNNPNRLTTDEWDRVVAVVCSGQEWQFKNWPISTKGTQDLFRRVQGFYFHYDDVAPTGNVEAWAIKKLTFSRHRRHTHSQVQAQFWNTLDAYMRRKGKHLRY